MIKFKVSLRGMQASVMDLYLHGNLRIVLKPLLQRLPLVGGMQVSKSKFPLEWIKYQMKSLKDLIYDFRPSRCTSCTILPLTLELEGWPMWQTCQGSVVSSGQHFNGVHILVKLHFQETDNGTDWEVCGSSKQVDRSLLPRGSNAGRIYDLQRSDVVSNLRFSNVLN